ncbi:MAG TPA: helix-turn-helix domain-containing protein [Acidimicrobiales bacterium]|nr:helix-turn-helix domain-containing protein [Acidimicrobiales bacterium]
MDLVADGAGWVGEDAPDAGVPGTADLGPDATSPPALTDAEFSAAVVAVTSAFGDPTRRQIYLFAREHDGGVTAGEVAERFNLHPNVARHHLDKLAAGGYLDVFLARVSHGGAGRPSKRYRLSGPAAGLELPLKGDDLLITLLGRALSLVPAAAAEAMAEEVGEEYGRRLAGQISTGGGQRSFRSALHAVADALTAHGFAAHAEARGRSLALIKDSCPFFDTARQHPVICAVDRGMVRGMLTGLYGEAVPATQSSRAMGDDACVTLV